MQRVRVLQRVFPMSTGCSDHLVRLEGTVHSAFEAWTSLKKNKSGATEAEKAGAEMKVIMQTVEPG